LTNEQQPAVQQIHYPFTVSEIYFAALWKNSSCEGSIEQWFLTNGTLACDNGTFPDDGGGGHHRKMDGFYERLLIVYNVIIFGMCILLVCAYCWYVHTVGSLLFYI